jgi:hypothetical protein
MPKNTVSDPITDQEIAFDAVLDRANPIRLSFSPNRRFSGQRR